MDLLCKKLIAIFFILTGLATAFYDEVEPSLINENLRLAALGNLNLILEDYGTEINIYNFGELASGVIADDNGKSSLYLRSIAGFDNTIEARTETDWSGGTIALGGIYRCPQWAIGGTLSGLTRDLGFYSPWEMSHVRYDIKSTCDTVVAALQVLKWMGVGLRGVYYRDLIKTTEYINYWDSDETLWLVDPSLSIFLPGGKWSIGFGFTYADPGPYHDADNAKTLTLPVVLSENNLTLGIKGKHTLAYRSDGYLTDKETFGGVQGIYAIPISNRTINIGFMIDRDITHHYHEYGDPIYNWFMDYGGGIALIDSNLGLVGIQIQQRIYYRYATAYPKQTILNIGLEFKAAKKVPIRFGCLHHTWDPESHYSYQNMVTAGFGLNLIKTTIVDFAYNLRMESIDSYDDAQQVFAVSGRISF